MIYGVLAALQIVDEKWLSSLSPERRASVLYSRKMARIRDKESNMKSRLERRREAIWARRWWTFFGAFLLMIAIPLAVAAVGLAWQAASYVVLG